jgi:Aldo/keto reductase family
VGYVNDGADTSRWHISTETEFVPDFTMGAFCLDDTGDGTVYFESSHLSPEIAGFYVTEPTSSTSTSMVYSHVKVYESNPALYLYKYEDKWMIGETVGGESCLSFVEDDAKTPSEIVSNDWRFVDLAAGGENGWIFDSSRIISKSSFPELQIDNIHQALREHRSLKSIPDKQQYISLRNNIPMPTMGLGTGGLQPGEQTTETLTTALGLGYRLFDLAREYNNEKAFAEVVRAHEAEGSVYRNEIFIESKVWPTELGYQPTTDAIHTSLELLNSNYIDLYLLHWPV